MLTWLMVLTVPILILLGAFLLAFQHSWKFLVPFLTGVGLLLLVLYAIGIHPLGFFVSVGGWILFAAASVFVAVGVRLVSVLVARRTAA